jgi:hypothetical protein
VSHADGGSYLQVKKCVATGGSWIPLRAGDRVLGRTIAAACAFALPLPPKPRENFACMIELGACEQDAVGVGWGACSGPKRLRFTSSRSVAARYENRVTGAWRERCRLSMRHDRRDAVA